MLAEFPLQPGKELQEAAAHRVDEGTQPADWKQVHEA